MGMAAPFVDCTLLRLETKTLDKIISISEAASLIHSGTTLALGGMTLYRRPMAFVRTLLRDNPDALDLTLLCFTAGIESDLLVGAGRVRQVRSCYFGLEAFGLAPMFTQAANQGTIDIVEETEASISFGIRASLASVGFMPGRAWVGTDLTRLRPDVRMVTDPYTGEELVAFPAIECDVAVIHALEADLDGNAVIGGNAGVDVELAMLADTTLITTERIVTTLARADIASPAVTGVALAPEGAWPTSCHPNYPLDAEEILHYVEACKSQQFDGFLAEIVSSLITPQSSREIP